LPPFSGFFIKLILLKLFMGIFSIGLTLLLLLISLAVLFAYMVVFFYFLGAKFYSGSLRVLTLPLLYGLVHVFFLLSFPLLALAGI
jgi:hypothetical protein